MKTHHVSSITIHYSFADVFILSIQVSENNFLILTFVIWKVCISIVWNATLFFFSPGINKETYNNNFSLTRVAEML